MIKATSKNNNYLTEITNGEHTFCADGTLDNGGGNRGMRPTEILQSAYAACTNITTRMVLDREGLKYESVTVYVDIDRSDLDNVKFFTRTEIIGDIPLEKKDEIIEKVKRCPVCRILRAEKEFLKLNIDEL